VETGSHCADDRPWRDPKPQHYGKLRNHCPNSSDGYPDDNSHNPNPLQRSCGIHRLYFLNGIECRLGQHACKAAENRWLDYDQSWEFLIGGTRIQIDDIPGMSGPPASEKVQTGEALC
jgi:hypothetical protein